MKYAQVLYERAFDTSRRLKIYGDTVEREKVSDGIAYPGRSRCSPSLLQKLLRQLRACYARVTLSDILFRRS